MSTPTGLTKRRLAWPLCCFWLGAFCCAPGLAGAQQPAGLGAAGPTVAVVEVHVAATAYPNTSSYANAMESALSGVKTVSLVRAADALRRLQREIIVGGDEADPALMARIDGMVQQADRLVFNDPASAIGVLLASRQRVREAVDSFPGDPRLREALFGADMLLARAYLDTDEVDRASEVLMQIARARGEDDSVSPERYHPRLVDLYHDALRSLEGDRLGVLEVRSGPPGGDIYLEGRKLEAQTPHLFRDLLPGTYHVQVRNAQTKGVVHRVRLDGLRPARVVADLELEGAMRVHNERLAVTFTEMTDLESKLATFGTTIGQRMAVDQIVAAGLMDRGTSTELVAYVIDVRTGRLVRAHGVHVDPATVEMSRVKELAVKVGSPGGVEEASGPKTWVSYWPGWVLVGAGAAGIGTSIYFYSAFNTARGHAENNLYPAHLTGAGATPVQQEQAARLRQDEADTANTSRTLAWVTGVGGVLAVAGGVTLFILKGSPDEQTSADGHLRIDLPGGLGVGPLLAPGQAGLVLGGHL
jgi:hypothetical protein